MVMPTEMKGLEVSQLSVLQFESKASALKYNWHSVFSVLNHGCFVVQLKQNKTSCFVAH